MSDQQTTPQPMPRFDAPASEPAQSQEPAVQTFVPQAPQRKPLGQGNQMPGQEDFDDLPPDPTQDGGTQQAQAPANPREGYEDEEPGFVDFETLLAAQQAPPANAGQQFQPTPAQVTPGQQPAQQPPQQAQPPAQQVPAQQPGQAPAQPAVVPPATPQQPAVGQQPQQQQQPAAPVTDPAQALQNIATGLKQSRDQFITGLSQHYEKTFSDEDIELFNTEPKKALSQWAARLHYDSLSNVMSTLSANLPSMVMGLMVAEQQNRETEQQFYSQFPHFNKAAHGQHLERIAASVRQMNPNLDAATFTAMVASIAERALQVVPGQVPVQHQQPTQPQRLPPTAVYPRSFVPAGNGQGQPPPQGQPKNPWADFVAVSQADD